MSEATHEEEDVELYEFVAAGENTCERCAAINHSVWREPPEPPPAHCECEVQPRIVRRHQPRDCNDNTWGIQSIPNGTVTYGPAADYGWEWGYIVTIDCWDGAVIEFEIWVDMGWDRDWPVTDTMFDDMEAFAWSELHDEAEAVAARSCRPCSPPLLV